MLKKNSADSKKHIGFFIGFSSIFREKSMKNRRKRVKTSHVHKNRQKITCGTLFFSKNAIFSEFLGSPRVPKGLPGRPEKFPKSLISLIHGGLRLKTTVDGLREASGEPRRCLQAPPGYDFALIFGSILHIKTKRKCTKNIEKTQKILNVSNTYTSIIK